MKFCSEPLPGVKPKTAITLWQKLEVVKYIRSLRENSCKMKKVYQAPVSEGTPVPRSPSADEKEEEKGKGRKSRGRSSKKKQVQRTVTHRWFQRGLNLQCLACVRFPWVGKNPVCRWVRDADLQKWDEIPELELKKLSFISEDWKELHKLRSAGAHKIGRKSGSFLLPEILEVELEKVVADAREGRTSTTRRADLVFLRHIVPTPDCRVGVSTNVMVVLC